MEEQNLKFIQITDYLDQLIQDAAWVIQEINCMPTDDVETIDFRRERYADTQDAIKKYINTIPQNQIGHVKEYFELRQKAYGKILRMKNKEKQEKNLRDIGVNPERHYLETPGQLAEALISAVSPAIERLQRATEYE